MPIEQKILFALLVILSCSHNVVTNEQHESDKEKRKSEDLEEFKPTDEWQPVKEGQVLPRGLHVRLNLETGEKEAKLLSDSSNERTDLLNPKDVNEDTTENADHIKAFRQSLFKLEDHGQEPPDQLVDTVRNNFRSYKELKETFKQLNMTVKTDLEIMHKLFSKFKTVSRSKEKNSTDEILLILTDLEYLVHQYDNALEFVRLEGISDIALPILNSTHPVLRAEAAHLLGSAAQSNVKVQIAAIENGAISALLKAVSLDSNATVRIRSLYALSCIIRNFPAAQGKFIKEGGLSVLSKSFEKGQENRNLQMKVITLLHDLLLERQDAAALISDPTTVNKKELSMKIQQYEAVHLEETLLEHGWCSRIAKFLLEQSPNWSRTKRRDDLSSALRDLPVRPEHDFVEKMAEALLAMVNLCHHEFNLNSDLKKFLNSLKEWYVELSLIESLNKSGDKISESSEVGDNSESYYYSQVANILKKLTEKMDKFNSKDEL